MIFTRREFSLPTGTVGDMLGEPNWPVGDMHLQDRVLLSPDITNTHKERTHYSRETHMTVSVSFRGFLLPHMENTKGPITAESTRVQHNTRFWVIQKTSTCQEMTPLPVIRHSPQFWRSLTFSESLKAEHDLISATFTLRYKSADLCRFFLDKQNRIIQSKVPKKKNTSYQKRKCSDGWIRK